MPKYQGYSDRKDESLGMRDGASRGKKQRYKDRRDESYGMSNKGVMGHDKQPKSLNVFKSQKRDMGKVDVRSMDYRGSPDQAFDYKY
jgi:hypothetical protein